MERVYLVLEINKHGTKIMSAFGNKEDAMIYRRRIEIECPTSNYLVHRMKVN